MEQANLLQGICDRTKSRLIPIAGRYWHKYYYLLIKLNPKGTNFVIEQCVDKDEKGKAKYWNSMTLLQKLNERIEGSRFNSMTGKLYVPASDKSSLIIYHACKGRRVLWGTEDSYATYCNLLMRWGLYIHAAKKQSDYRLYKRVDAVGLTLPSPEGIKAGDYQRASASCAIGLPGYGFFMEQGAGKTFPAIMTMEYHARQWAQTQRKMREKDETVVLRPFHTVIVAPKSVVFNWETELEKFTTGRGLITTLSGAKIKRVKQLIDVIVAPNSIDNEYAGYDWTATLLSYGLLSRDVANLLHVEWGLCVLDESHFIKSETAQRTKAAHRLRDKSARRLALTGTPIPNKIHDLHAQLEFLGQGYSGFPTASQFAKAYQKIESVQDAQGRMHSNFVGIKNEDELQEKLSTIAFFINKKDAIKDLPEKTYDVLGVSMGGAQLETYQSALSNIIVECREMVAQAESAGGGRGEMVLQNVLKRMLRLSQITSGFFVSDPVMDEEGNEIYPSETTEFKPNPKIIALLEFLRDKPSTSKALVWSNWRRDIQVISEFMDLEGMGYVRLQGGMSRKAIKENVEAFNNTREVQFIIGNPMVGGVGLNLLGHCDEETNCDSVVYFSKDWNAATRRQSEDRCYRKGTRCHVQITDIMVPSSIDTQIHEALIEKHQVANRAQNIRRMLTKLEAINANLGE